MIDDEKLYEPDPFPSQPPTRLAEPTVLDQAVRQYRENDRIAREIEALVRRRCSPPPFRRK